MGKRTRVLSGESARIYFRALFVADPHQTSASAARLAETCMREISELRVRVPQMTTRTGTPEPTPKPIKTRALATAPPSASTSALASASVQPAPVASIPPATEAFDPFAFSLIVVYRRDGRNALLDRLKAVGDVRQLKEIAKAQHIGLPPDINGLAELCVAIVAGTERRLAHREAAAS